MVVFPEMRGSNQVLVAARINMASGAKIDKVDLTSATADNFAPSVASRDTDNDGYADESTVVWVIESPTATTLVGSSFDAQNPGVMGSGSTISAGVTNLDNTTVAITDHNAVAVWQTRTGSQQVVKSAPITLDGHALCL